MPFVCALALAPPARTLGFRARSSLVGQRVEGALVPPDHTRLEPDAPAPTAEPAR